MKVCSKNSDYQEPQECDYTSYHEYAFSFGKFRNCCFHFLFLKCTGVRCIKNGFPGQFALLHLFYSILLMMWYPNLVLTGTEVWPFSSSNAAFSNSLTILPLVNVPRSPPFFPDGH